MLSAELEQVILRYFEDLDCPFSLMCSLLWRHGEKEALVRLNCRPGDYDTPERYLRSVSALAFVKKLRGLLPNESERRKATVAKWWEGEVSCYRTNQRLYPYLHSSRVDRDESIARHLAGIKEVVVELIGQSPGRRSEGSLVDYDAIYFGRHGPGATFNDRGRATTVPHKMSSDPTITHQAYAYLLYFSESQWAHAMRSDGKEVKWVRGNRFSVAPKTSVIDRPIAIEPSLNVFYQLAAGAALRRRLRRSHGWDLDRAQDIHRQTALAASRSREFATLDLSNASDTVAYNLVKLLLPHAWFSVLDDLRSPFTSHPDHTEKWVKLEKFSSMGNGFTFELETVLFAAAAIYCSRQCGHAGVLGWDTFVFGDDIIVKDDVVRSLTGVLHYLGFSLNAEKSFSGMSPFRESCGADFYVGADVRPVYLKDDPQDVKDAFGVCNRISQTVERLAAFGSRRRFNSWRYARALLPLPYRNIVGPRRLGDAVVWVDGWEKLTRVRWRHSIRYVRALKPGSKVIIPYERFSPQVVLACATYGAGNEGTPVHGSIPPIEGVVPRDGIRSYVIGWVADS